MSKRPTRHIISRSGTFGSLTVRRRSEPGWPEQYERMRRMFARLMRDDHDQQEQLDDFMIFFQTAWHLKDWIRNDENLAASICDGIESKVRQRDMLLICRDLAVGGKHFEVWPIPGRPKALLGVVTRKQTKTTMRLGSNREPEITIRESSEGVVVLVPPEIEGLPAGEHDADLETLSALSVARDVVAAWDKLLADLGLRT